MINVSNAYRTSFIDEAKSITITFPDNNITLTNDDIVEDSLKLTERIETENMLMFIGSKASKFEIKTKALLPDLRDKAIAVTIYTGSGSIPLFYGYVDEQNNLNYEDEITSISAYDPLYSVNTASMSSWYNSLTFPLTISQFRTEFWNHFGLTESQTELLFDNLSISKTIDPIEMSGRDILIALCQLNCVFVKYGRNRTIEYVSLDSSNPIAISKSEYKKIDYENFKVKKIGKVVIRTDEDDVGTIAGDGVNTYTIEDNFLVFGKNSTEMESIANSIWNKVKDIDYCPCEIECAGMPFFEVGDCITVPTAKNNVVTFVMERELSGINSLKDTYIARGHLYRYSNINSTNKEIVQLKGKANRLTRTIDETNSRIEDVESGLSSQIRQTAEEIELQITNIYSELDGSINVYNTNEVPTLNNYPAWDFTYNIPCNNTVQTTDTLSFEYNDEFYRKNVRSIAYDLANSTTYRFKKTENTWGWVEVADTEYSLLMSRVTALEIKDGEIESSITSIYDDIGDLESEQTTLSSKITQTDDKITAEVSRSKGAESTLASSITQTATEIRAEVSNNYATKSSLNLTDDRISTEVSRAETVEKALASTITQTASSIRAEVSSGYATKASLELKVDKDDNGQIISMINASADRISLESGRLVINSGNFLLDANGTITATNGNFSGTITSSSGAIGGWDISGSGISKISESGHKVIFQSDGTLVCYKPNNGGVAWALTNNGGAQIPGYVTTSTLTANYITAGTISSTYATISNLDSAVARIGSLEATSITTSNLSAQISSLAAVYANSLWIGGKFVTSVDMSIGGRIRKVLVYEEQH